MALYCAKMILANKCFPRQIPKSLSLLYKIVLHYQDILNFFQGMLKMIPEALIFQKELVLKLLHQSFYLQFQQLEALVSYGTMQLILSRALQRKAACDHDK